MGNERKTSLNDIIIVSFKVYIYIYIAVSKMRLKKKNYINYKMVMTLSIYLSIKKKL